MQPDGATPQQPGRKGAAVTPWGATGNGEGAQHTRPPAWRSSSPLVPHCSCPVQQTPLSSARAGPDPSAPAPSLAPLPSGSLQPLRCPASLRGNQKHKYLKPCDKAATELIQAQPNPVPSPIQQRTRSFCGGQYYVTHVLAAGGQPCPAGSSGARSRGAAMPRRRRCSQLPGTQGLPVLRAPGSGRGSRPKGWQEEEEDAREQDPGGLSAGLG